MTAVVWFSHKQTDANILCNLILLQLSMIQLIFFFSLLMVDARQKPANPSSLSQFCQFSLSACVLHSEWDFVSSRPPKTREKIKQGRNVSILFVKMEIPDPERSLKSSILR